MAMTFSCEMSRSSCASRSVRLVSVACANASVIFLIATLRCVRRSVAEQTALVFTI